MGDITPISNNDCDDIVLPSIVYKGNEVATGVKISFTRRDGGSGGRFRLKMYVPSSSSVSGEETIDISGRVRWSKLQLTAIGTEIGRGIEFNLEWRFASGNMNIKIGSSKMDQKVPSPIDLIGAIAKLISDYIHGATRG